MLHGAIAQDPVIFGSNPPQLRLYLVNGGQRVYSKSNFNLYREGLCSDGTMSVAQLLRYRTPFTMPGGLELTRCDLCNLETPCRMLIEAVTEMRVEVEEIKRQWPLEAFKLRHWPDLSRCPILSTIIRQTESEAEKRFVELFYEWAICGWAPTWDGANGRLHFWTGPLQVELLEIHKRKQIGLYPAEYKLSDAADELIESLSRPALMPQVWINWVYDPDVNPKDQEKTVLRDMPSRVDFLMIKDFKPHVVEIDGPSHYARFDDRTRTYQVDEETYTRNLRIDRRLRFDGWHIHRFSNWEILNSSEIELMVTVLEELGLKREPCVSENADAIPY